MLKIINYRPHSCASSSVLSDLEQTDPGGGDFDFSYPDV